MARALGERLRGRHGPLGYVSFLSALVHHGALLDGVAVIQVASPELGGRERDLRPGPVDFVLVPRDQFFGFRLEELEGETVPVASPEKALLDWVYLAEDLGIDPRLDEIEWDAIDVPELDRLAAECGIDYRAILPRVGASRHDQGVMRQLCLDALPRPI